MALLSVGSGRDTGVASPHARWGVRSFLMNTGHREVGSLQLVSQIAEDGGRRMSPGCQGVVCSNHDKAVDGSRNLRQQVQKKVLKEPFFMNQRIALSYRTRREIVARMAPQYREASLARKRTMLDSLVEMTGYARKYAIGLLNQEPQGPPTIRRPRQSCYSSEVQQALGVAWRATRYICAKRLIPFLPKPAAGDDVSRLRARGNPRDEAGRPHALRRFARHALALW